MSLVACIYYAIASISLTLCNRALFKVFDFNFPATITAIQLVLSTIFLQIFKLTGALPVDSLQWKYVPKLAPLTLAWWIYVVSGVSALQYLNVSLYNAIRRCTPLLLAWIERHISGSHPSPKRMVSLRIAAFGALLAAARDVELHPAGIFWVTLCIVSTCVYLLKIKSCTEETKLNEQTMLMYNNAIGIPLMLTYLLIWTDEAQRLATYTGKFKTDFQLFLLFTCSQAFILNYCLYRCTTLNSPLATAVTGQLKDFATVAIGTVFLNDSPRDVLYLSGILIGFIGGVSYALVTLIENDKNRNYENSAVQDKLKQAPKIHPYRTRSSSASL